MVSNSARILLAFASVSASTFIPPASGGASRVVQWNQQPAMAPHGATFSSRPSNGNVKAARATQMKVKKEEKKKSKSSETGNMSTIFITDIDYGKILLNFLNPFVNPNSLALYAILIINILAKFSSTP